jgi:hypothetical protein
MRRGGKRFRNYEDERRIADPTPTMQRQLGDDVETALPLPLVSEIALDWRRDRLAGRQVEPARPLTALESR